MELKMNFSSAAEKTVEILMSDPKYSMENVDQFVADFTQSMAARNSRNMELKMNFSSAAEKTVEILMSDPKYSMENVDQFVADFTQSMAAAFDSNAAVVVEVMNADREKGMLSLKITGEFTHPNGRKGTVQDERTVIFRQNPEGEEKHYTVSFYVSDASGQSECYKLYEIEEGAIATEPSRRIRRGRRSIIR